MLDWQTLEDLQGQGLRQLSSRDFLSWLKLKEDLGALVNHVSRSPAEMEAAVEAARDDFATKARRHLVYLLKVVLSGISLNAVIVKGMSSFDPFVLLYLPIEQATYCFSAL